MTVFFVVTKNLTLYLCRFTNIIRDSTLMLVTDKHPTRSRIRIHELCIAWSLIVHAGILWQFKVVISRPVYFTRSLSRSVNFFSTSWYQLFSKRGRSHCFVANCMWKLVFRGTRFSHTYLYLTNRGILSDGVLLFCPAL
jgi:hypothetical protein